MYNTGVLGVTHTPSFSSLFQEGLVPLFSPALGGELVDSEAKLAGFFQDTVKIPQIIESFTDIRLHPRIPLKQILASGHL